MSFKNETITLADDPNDPVLTLFVDSPIPIWIKQKLIRKVSKKSPLK